MVHYYDKFCDAVRENSSVSIPYNKPELHSALTFTKISNQVLRVALSLQQMDISYNETFFLLVGGAFLIVAFLLKQHTIQRKSLPPGPRACPVIGHLHLLMNKKKGAAHVLSSLSTKYGPIMSLRFGSQPVVLISSSALVKECFTTHDICFASRVPLIQGKILGYDYFMFSLAPYGPYWRMARKICTMELLSSKRIQTFMPIRTKEISRAVNSFLEKSEVVVNMRSVFSELTFRVLMGMIVRDRYFEGDLGISAGEVTSLVEEYFELHTVFDVGDFIPWLRWFDLQGNQKAMENLMAKLDYLMQKIVEKHRQNPVNKEEDMDFIDVLQSQAELNQDSILDKDSFIKSTALLMLSAGSDTSAVTLEWALSLLLCHPHVMKKAQQELDSKVGHNRVVQESDISQLPYLQAIVKETLRLYPPAPWLVQHKSQDGCTLGGFHIPAGTMLMVNARAIHEDPSAWIDPLDFVPERFLDRDIDVSIEMKGNNFDVIPFGAGRRSCPGTLLAMSMVQTILGTFLQCFDWYLPNGEMEGAMNEVAEGLLKRAVPLKVVVKPRLSNHLYGVMG